MVPPPLPPGERLDRALGRGYLRLLVMHAIGLWPLTAVVLLAAALLWSAGMRGAP